MSNPTRSPARTSKRPRGRLSRRIFVLAGLACGGAWLTKQAAIALNGGEWSLVVGILWTVGILALLTWAAAGVATLMAGRPLWLRVLAAGIAVPVAFILHDVVDALAKSVYTGGGWFRDELGLVLVGVAVFAVSLLARPAPEPDRHSGLS